ncbi:hypothetical protein IAU59_007054 [Kwoniella sp. CBS 9459]
MNPFNVDTSPPPFINHNTTGHRAQAQHEPQPQPHPLNPDFRFPPVPPFHHHSAQRSISQPLQQFQPHPTAHDRRLTLNSEATHFTYRPLEVSSPLDSGFQRLKRYHDDPSALGMDFSGADSPPESSGYGSSTKGRSHIQAVSPGKAALAQSLKYDQIDNYQLWNEQAFNAPTTAPIYDLPPHFQPTHGSSLSVSPIPRVHAPSPSLSGSRYIDDRSSLGIAHAPRTSPLITGPPHLLIPQTGLATHQQTPPQPLMTRAWTLDSSSRTTLSPLAQSHDSLPLTRSPLAHSQHGQGSLLPGQISPSHSATSAPLDGKRYRSEPIRRMKSYSPSNRNRDRKEEDDETDRRYRGFKGREGGPPKAKLGGVGGKTYDEMIATRSPAPGIPAAAKDDRLETPSMISSASTGEYRWKGNPINIKLPPPRYSPPDTPPEPLLQIEDGQGPIGTEAVPKLPRREAYPWPGHRIRLSATGTPLPPSPSDPAEDTVRRPSITSTESTEASTGGMWRGKEVLVSVPDDNCWERLRPATPEHVTELEDGSASDMEPEAEVSAVLQPLPPSESEDSDTPSSRSVDMVEDTVPLATSGKMDENVAFADPFKAEHLPWDQYPESPVQRRSSSQKLFAGDPLTSTEQALQTQQDTGQKDSLFSLIPHPSLPAKPVTTDDPPAYLSSATDDSLSPSRRNFSIKVLANTDFSKRSLGGVLKGAEEGIISSPATKRRRDGSDLQGAPNEIKADAPNKPKLSIIEKLKQEKGREDEFEEVNLTPLDTFPSKMRAWGRTPSPPPSTSSDGYLREAESTTTPETTEAVPTTQVPVEMTTGNKGKLRAWTPSPVISTRSLDDDEVKISETQSSLDGSLPLHEITPAKTGSDSKMRAWTPSPPLSPEPSLSLPPVSSSVAEEEVLEADNHKSLAKTAPVAQSDSVQQHLPRESASILRAWTPSPPLSASLSLSPMSRESAIIIDSRPTIEPVSRMRAWAGSPSPSPAARPKSQDHHKEDENMSPGGTDMPKELQIGEQGETTAENLSRSVFRGVEQPTALEVARQKALASRKSKRRAEDEDSSSVAAAQDRSPVLEAARRRVVVSREKKGISYVQKQLGGLLKGFKPSVEAEILDQPLVQSLQESAVSGTKRAKEVPSGEEGKENAEFQAKDEHPATSLPEAKRLRPTAAIFKPPSFNITMSDQSTKRLRPTAEAWRPPRSLTLGKKPSFGAIGLTARQQAISPSLPVPGLTPSAAPFVPHSTSFTWMPQLFPNTEHASLPPVLSSAAPDRPSYLPSSAIRSQSGIHKEHGSFTFAYPQTETADVRTGTGDRPTLSDLTKPILKPTAAPFVPIKSGPDGNAVTSGHRKVESMVSNASSQPKLRPFAAPFIPPQSVADPETPAQSQVAQVSDPATLAKSIELDNGEQSSPVSSVDRVDEASIAPSIPAEVNLSPYTSTEQLSRFSSQDFVRPPSSNDQRILPPASIPSEQQEGQSTSELPKAHDGLGVVQQRGRADTVAFGPPGDLVRHSGSEIVRGSESSTNARQKQVTAEDSRLEVDLRARDAPKQLEEAGLEVHSERPLPLSPSQDSTDSAVLAWRAQASPLPVPGSYSDLGSERSTSVDSHSTSQSQDRVWRSSRASSFRQEENSHRSRDLPIPSAMVAVVPLHEITIHQSQPVQIPLSAVPLRASQDLPDPPVSAHTHAPSGGSIVSNTASAQDSSRYRPLPPIPQSKGQDSEPNSTSTFASPAQTDETAPQTTGDTFASAAYQTADGSPLVPTRMLFEDSVIRPYRPLPDIPTPKQAVSEPQLRANTELQTSGSNQENETAAQEEDESSSDEEVTLSIYPHVDVRGRRQDGFSRSAAPSPDLSVQEYVAQVESHEVIETEQRSGGANADDDQDEGQFRQWAFPLGAGSSNLSQLRHTVRRPMIAPESDHEMHFKPQTTEPSSALSTTTGDIPARPIDVTEQEQAQGAEQDLLPRAVDEIAVLENKERLEIVGVSDNCGESATPRGQSRGGNASRPVFADRMANNGLDEVIRILRKREHAEQGWRGALEDFRAELMLNVRGVVIESREDLTSGPHEMDRMTSILEEQSQILTSLHDKLRTSTPDHKQDGSANLESSRSEEIFAAILTGQHAILDKFDEVATSQSDDALQLRQAISDLQVQQASASQQAQMNLENEESMRALEEELRDARISVSESRAQADVLKQRLIDTRQDRDDLRHELDETNLRLEEATMYRKRMEGESDGLVARALAAELERDALAKVVVEGRDIESSLRAELQEWKEELEKEKETSRLALAEKETEIVAVQAQLHAHLYLTREREQAQVQAQAQYNAIEPSASASALAELSQTAVTFQEEVMARFGKLDEHMHESMGSRVKEYEAVLDRNRILQGEVDGLRGRLEDSADRFAKLQLKTTNALSKAEIEHKTLLEKLEAEQSKRLEGEARLESMAKEVQRAKAEKMNFQLIAAQLEATSRQSEVRLQALTQENVYWRQFALEHDRRRFKHYLSTQPFKGVRSSQNIVEAQRSTGPESGREEVVVEGEDEVKSESDDGDAGGITPKSKPLTLVEDVEAATEVES